MCDRQQISDFDLSSPEQTAISFFQALKNNNESIALELITADNENIQKKIFNKSSKEFNRYNELFESEIFIDNVDYIDKYNAIIDFNIRYKGKTLSQSDGMFKLMDVNRRWYIVE